MKQRDSLKVLSREIGQLEHRMYALRAKRRALAVREIVRLMRQSHITPEEITAAYQPLMPKPSVGPVPRMDGRTRVEPKYRDPETGKTWTGRGVIPRWLAAAELDGRNRQHFVVDQHTRL
ncbi:H-NS histone family protein [Achromobacter sp. AGC78]|uniref:H-NS histone family protein n=1 Tax=Achromobacter spanius TaxID=217203 RepID=A0AA42LVE1_9BURK|nr:H-NS histone family protein [Achromobacter spanius]MDH0740149.1 H-NS histone family protein [Achromobacter spanius]